MSYQPRNFHERRAKGPRAVTAFPLSATPRGTRERAAPGAAHRVTRERSRPYGSSGACESRRRPRTASGRWRRGSRRSGIGTGYLRGCVARDELPRGPRVAGGRGVEQCRGDGTGERLHRGIVSGQRRRLPRQDHQGERIPRPAQRLRLRWHARLSAHRFSWTRPPDARSLALTSPFPKPLVPPRSRRRSPRMSRTSSSPPSP